MTDAEIDAAILALMKSDEPDILTQQEVMDLLEAVKKENEDIKDAKTSRKIDDDFFFVDATIDDFSNKEIDDLIKVKKEGKNEIN